MVTTLVLDPDKRPLGYLDHGEVVIRVPELVAWVPRLRTSCIDFVSMPVETVDRVVFQWAAVMSSRSLDDCYQVWVLTTAAKPEVLNDVPGFRWFAEVHGTKVKR